MTELPAVLYAEDKDDVLHLTASIKSAKLTIELGLKVSAHGYGNYLNFI